MGTPRAPAPVKYLIGLLSAERGLLECAAFLAENIHNSDGHSEALKTIVPLFLKRGEVDLAAELANSIEDPFTRDKLLIQVAEKCAAVDDDEYAMQLAEAIEDDGLRGEAFETIALQKSGRGELEKADEMANDLAHPEYVYADIAVRHAAMSDNANSEMFLTRIEFPAAKVAALEAITDLQFNSGEIEKALSSLTAARSLAADIEHQQERLRLLSEIGNHFIRIGSSEEAIRTFEIVRDNAAELPSGRRGFFLVSASLGFLQAGSMDLADATLDLVSDLTQMASALVGFSKELARNGETDEALESLEEAYSIIRTQRDAEVRDSRARFTVQRMIAVQFAQMGKGDRAIECAQEIGDSNENATALGEIAQLLATDNSEMSEQAIQGIPNDSDRLFALIGVSDFLRRSGNEERSLETLSEATMLADSISQPPVHASVLGAIAARYAERGLTEDASSILHQALEVIFRIRDESSRSVAIANVSDVFESAGIEPSETDTEILRSIVGRVEW